MNPNEIKKLKEKAPFPIIVLLMLFFLPPFLLTPESELLNENISGYDSLLKKARQNHEKRYQYRQKKEALDHLKSIHAEIQSQLPSKDMLPEIIDEINNNANKNSVYLASVNYFSGEKINGIKIDNYRIIMNLTAFYEDMRRFIAALESMRYPLMVSEVVVTEGRNYNITLRQLVK
ncbi:MAG: hypothetical protein Kow0029_24220 [Candidatus Rifleibacteriota bacterium]